MKYNYNIKIFIYLNFFFFLFTNINNIFLISDIRFIDNIIFFKKFNSILKKKNLNTASLFTNLKSNSKFDLNSSYKYIFFKNKILINQIEENQLQNNMKFFDLKKKFFKFLTNYKSLYNFYFFKKFNGKKSNFKAFSRNFFFYKNFSLFFENNKLIQILINLKYIFNTLDYFYLVDKNKIFLNRSVLKNSEILLKKGDLIEIFYWKFYFFYLIKLNSYLFKVNQKNFKSKNIDLSLRILNNKFAKILNYSYNTIFSKYIFFENDFSTLSFFFVYNNIKLTSNFFSYFYFCLYKWKH